MRPVSNIANHRYLLYLRTRFLFILEIQYFSLFFLLQLHLPRPPRIITSWGIFFTFSFQLGLWSMIYIFDLPRSSNVCPGDTKCWLTGKSVFFVRSLLCPFILTLVRATVSRISSTVGQCKPCGDKRCKCCLQLQRAQMFHSKTTGKEHSKNSLFFVFDSLSNLDCGQWYTF
jgi:hypothetical protein